MRGQDRGHGREGLGPGHVFKMVSESPFFFPWLIARFFDGCFDYKALIFSFELSGKQLVFVTVHNTT